MNYGENVKGSWEVLVKLKIQSSESVMKINIEGKRGKENWRRDWIKWYEDSSLKWMKYQDL